jgi:hypothetical protein
MFSAASAAAPPTLDVVLTSLAGTDILDAEGIRKGHEHWIKIVAFIEICW